MFVHCTLKHTTRSRTFSQTLYVNFNKLFFLKSFINSDCVQVKRIKEQYNTSSSILLFESCVIIYGLIFRKEIARILVSDLWPDTLYNKMGFEATCNECLDKESSMHTVQ